MLFQFISDFICLGQFMSGNLEWGQDKSGYVRLFQVVRLGHVMSDYNWIRQVTSRYFRLGQVRSVFVWLVPVKSGYFRLW